MSAYRLVEEEILQITPASKPLQIVKDKSNENLVEPENIIRIEEVYHEHEELTNIEMYYEEEIDKSPEIVIEREFIIDEDYQDSSNDESDKSCHDEDSFCDTNNLIDDDFESFKINYVCQYCDKKCSSLKDLNIHSKQCIRIINISPEKLLDFREEVVDKDLEEFYECGQCKNILIGNKNYIKHVKNVHDNLNKNNKQNIDLKTLSKTQNFSNQSMIIKSEDIKAIPSPKKGMIEEEINDIKDISNDDLTDNSSEERRVKQQEYRCICTWCDYESNRYSHVKSHIKTQHEMKKNFSCKECPFVGKNVEEYGIHYSAYHATDNFKHACTTCSFKCNNRSVLKSHYLSAHNKQRILSCKLCNYKVQDMMNMKKHLNKVHSNPIFHCKACNKKFHHGNEYRKHLAVKHAGVKGFEGECPNIRFEMNDVRKKSATSSSNLTSSMASNKEPVPETHILEEQIFEDHVLMEGKLESTTIQIMNDAERHGEIDLEITEEEQIPASANYVYTDNFVHFLS